MGRLWGKSKVEHLDLVDEANAEAIGTPKSDLVEAGLDKQTAAPTAALSLDALAVDGVPLLVPVDRIEEDPANPRTEFPDEEISELAQDIALRGILQPIVVRPAADAGYRVLFGAKRLRAAKRAGLKVVPVVIGSEAHDAYAQAARGGECDLNAGDTSIERRDDNGNGKVGSDRALCRVHGSRRGRRGSAVLQER